MLLRESPRASRSWSAFPWALYSAINPRSPTPDYGLLSATAPNWRSYASIQRNTSIQAFSSALIDQLTPTWSFVRGRSGEKGRQRWLSAPLDLDMELELEDWTPKNSRDVSIYEPDLYSNCKYLVAKLLKRVNFQYDEEFIDRQEEVRQLDYRKALSCYSVQIAHYYRDSLAGLKCKTPPYWLLFVHIFALSSELHKTLLAWYLLVWFWSW